MLSGGALLLAALYLRSPARWVAGGMAIYGIGAGLDFLISMFPASRARELARKMVILPVELSFALLMLGGMVTGILVSVGALFLFVYLALMTAVEPLLAESGADWAILYLALLTTVTISAYAGDNVLLPLKWLLRFAGPERHPNADLIQDTTRMLRAINFRRLSYQIGIAGFVVSAAIGFGGIAVPSQFDLVQEVALEALVGFIAIDAYISTFHPKWIRAMTVSD